MNCGVLATALLRRFVLPPNKVLHQVRSRALEYRLLHCSIPTGNRLLHLQQLAFPNRTHVFHPKLDLLLGTLVGVSKSIRDPDQLSGNLLIYGLSRSRPPAAAESISVKAKLLELIEFVRMVR